MDVVYYRSGISIYSYLPAHGGDSPTTQRHWQIAEIAAVCSKPLHISTRFHHEEIWIKEFFTAHDLRDINFYVKAKFLKECHHEKAYRNSLSQKRWMISLLIMKFRKHSSNEMKSFFP
jgi:hypothetical protein